MSKNWITEKTTEEVATATPDELVPVRLLTSSCLDSRLGACDDEVMKFIEHFGNACFVTPENIEKAWDIDLDVNWLLQKAFNYLEMKGIEMDIADRREIRDDYGQQANLINRYLNSLNTSCNREPQLVTSYMLTEINACPEQVTLFEQTFPYGCLVTVANREKAEKAGLEVSWLISVIEDWFAAYDIRLEGADESNREAWEVRLINQYIIEKGI